MSNKDDNSIPPFADGRDRSTGRFAKGWRGGSGNPHAALVMSFRRAMLESVTTEQISQMFKDLVDAALAGNAEARSEVLDRCCGRSVPADMLGEIGELAENIEELRTRIR